MNRRVLGPDNFATVELSSSIVGFSYAILDNKIYVFSGGVNKQYGAENGRYIYIYDMIENSWETRYDITMPTDITMSAVCAYDKYIYFFGGYNNSGICKYDPYAEKWTQTGLGKVDNIDFNNYIYCSGIEVTEDGYGYFAGFTPDINKTSTLTQLCRYNFKTESFELYGAKFNSNTFFINHMPLRTDMESVSVFQVDSTSSNVAVYQAPVRVVDEYHFKQSNTFRPYVCSKLDENNEFMAVSVENNQLKIEIMKYDDLERPFMTSTAYEPVEIYVSKSDNPVKDIIIPWNAVTCTSNTDVSNNLFFPVFVDNKIGIVAIYQPEYITNSEQLIEMTARSEIDGIEEIISCEIYGEEPKDTFLRFAFSIDGRNTYKFFNFSTLNWEPVTNKKSLYYSGQGMSTSQVEMLTRADWDKLVKDSTGTPYGKLDIAVTLLTLDPKITPAISEIRFRAVK